MCTGFILYLNVIDKAYYFNFGYKHELPLQLCCTRQAISISYPCSVAWLPAFADTLAPEKSDGKRSEMTEGNERSETVASEQYNRLNTGGLFEKGRAPRSHFGPRPTGSADGKRMITGAFPEAQIDGF